MIIEIDFDFLVKHKMTVQQYMLCYILDEDKRHEVQGRPEKKSGTPLAQIYRYTENVEKISSEGMQDLLDRGYLKQTGDVRTPDHLVVTSKFKQEVFNHWTNFNQLFDIYPDRINFGVGKSSASLKSLDKPKEEMGEYYAKVVRTNKKHKEVLAIVQWAKERDMLRVGIQKFVYSRGWDMLKEKYELGEIAEYSNDFETMI